jgi:hypothetical protein
LRRIGKVAALETNNFNSNRRGEFHEERK